jgi:hypothetical protein
VNRLYPVPVLLAVALCSGCDDDTTDPVVLEDCPAAVAVVAGSGLNPTFNWQPQCQLFFINIEPADAGNDLWTVITRGENGISPTVTYGVVPAGATQLTEPAVLEAGTAYKVVLARFTGPGDDDGEIIAIEEFTP